MHKCEHKTLHVWGDFSFAICSTVWVSLCPVFIQHPSIDHYYVACLVPGAGKSKIMTMCPTAPSRREDLLIHSFVHSVNILIILLRYNSQLKIHPFNVYNSVVLKVVRKLCKYHHCLIPEHFLSPPQKETPYPLAITPYTLLPHSSPWQLVFTFWL